MNLAQLIKKARLGCDAILPGGSVSSQWSDEEMVDLANDAYDEVWRRYRLARKKWGLLTVKQSDSAFDRDGETYTPSTALQITSAKPTVTLPPDCGDLVRITCLNNRSIRFRPASYESFYWIDLEQDAQDNAGTLLLSTPDFLTLFYDIVGSRTLVFTPPISTTLNLQIDYIPIKRPLYFSTAGTIEQSGTTLTGTGTTWQDDGIYAEDTLNAAELIVGTNALTSALIRLDRDYPRVAAVTSNTSATMVRSATISAGSQYLMVMAPALPRDVHRWLADYISALMLKKINPELAGKYGEDILERFDTSIRPTAGQRQTQESPVTEDAEEFGVHGTL